MRGHSAWNYTPYRPPLIEVGNIYICRLVPSEQSIRIEWLDSGAPEYNVHIRPRGTEPFTQVGTTTECAFEVDGLTAGTDYEFFVQAGQAKSRVRLARTGACVGSVINYVHPEDMVYDFSGHYFGSPSMIRCPQGHLLASMDLFAINTPQNLTLIFRSDDDGVTWRYVTELMPSFWTKLFIHKGEVYALSCHTEYGDLQIGKSTDGGNTFSTPVTLIRGANGKKGSSGVHKNPQNILYHNGRMYTTLEWGAWANKDYCHAAMVMSCDENADLMVPENWHFTPPVKFDHFAPELCDRPKCTMTIEGTLVLAPDGRLLNIMRFSKYGHALVYEVNTADPDAPLTYSHLMPFAANYSKFMIQYDAVTEKYLSIGCVVYDREKTSARNYLVLLTSSDLHQWENTLVLYDLRHEDHNQVGMQYVDFIMEGDDLLYMSRTAMNGAHTFHDSNYMTFHRIKNFRQYIQKG